MALEDRTDSSLVNRLNETERDVLRLLGQGHTAKSIAALRSLSVAAVNERLRASRRKMGVSSSRELARLLAAQENRDDFIELAGAAAPPSESPRPNAAPPPRPSSFKRWRLPMLATGLIAVALLAQQTAVPFARDQSQPAAGDGLASGIISQLPLAPDLAFMHVEVARGPRDPAWSEAMGYTLLQRYRQVPGFEGALQSFSLDCAATLCEVAGITRPELSSDQVTALMSDLQTLGHPSPMPGLDQVVHQFSTTTDQPGSFAFVSYWRRKD